MIKEPLAQLPKLCFDLRVVGDSGLHVNPAGLLAAEIEKQEKRYLKKKPVVKKTRQSMSPAKNAIYIGNTNKEGFLENLRESIPDKNRRIQTAKYRQHKVDFSMYSPTHSMKNRLNLERDA